MEPKAVQKNVVILLLIAVSITSWWWAISFYNENKGEITWAVERIAREIALPYHLAELSVEDPRDTLPVPVYGVLMRDITDTWGAARAAERTHEGVDIFASRGTPVFSATDGYVTRLNIGTVGGLNVMVGGPGGVQYYYAHLDRVARGIERGERVTPDTVLGFVGSTGNASGTPSHLHFGIYPERGSWEAQNPYPLLIDR